MLQTHPLIDGKQAAARIGFATDEVIAIYTVTPASPMEERSDARADAGGLERPQGDS